MKVKNIILEEIDDFDFVRDTVPYNLSDPWIITYQNSEEHMEAQRWLFTKGYSWHGIGEEVISATGIGEDDLPGFLFSGRVYYDVETSEDSYPHSDTNFNGYGGRYGYDMLTVVNENNYRNVYPWSSIKQYID